MIKHLHGLFIENPEEDSKIVVYARGFDDAGVMTMIRVCVAELPIKELMKTVDTFELMVTVEKK